MIRQRLHYPLARDPSSWGWVGRCQAALGVSILGKRLDWRTIFSFGLPFTLYLLTLAPTVYNLDSAELTTAAATAGLTRSTGYPLYLTLGHLWSRIPIGDIGYRMNLFSAFAGALTIALLERILRRWSVGGWAALGALGLLATSMHFWALSLIAEVYTLQTALMAGLILLLLRWGEKPTAQRLALVGLALGLGLAHHGATVLLLPGCLWYFGTARPRKARSAAQLLGGAVGMILGLSFYLYLPFRHAAAPAYNYAGSYDAAGSFVPADLQTLGGFLGYITGRSFSGLMLAYQGAGFWRELAQFMLQLWRAFFAIGIGPGLLGAAALLRRYRPLGGMLLLMFGFNALFFVDYQAVDKETMFLPTYVIWALWLGLGYHWLHELLRGRMGALRGRWHVRLFRGLISMAVPLAIVWNWQLVDLSQDSRSRELGERILRQLEPDALVLGYWDIVPILEYLQAVEGWRADVRAINRFLITPWDMASLIQKEVVQRPVYIDSLPADLPADILAVPEASLYRLMPRWAMASSAACTGPARRLLERGNKETSGARTPCFHPPSEERNP